MDVHDELPTGIDANHGEAAYPSELEACVDLPNGKQLRIRALRRGEEGPIRELDAHLSPRTRYLRFFTPMPALPDSVVQALVRVDYRRQLALIAEHDDGAGGEIVGLGSFAANDDRSVEVALVIRDEWQHQSVGTELARRLLHAAEARGFHRFTGWVLSENVAIRRLLRQMGDVVSANVSGGASEVTFVRRLQTP